MESLYSRDIGTKIVINRLSSIYFDFSIEEKEGGSVFSVHRYKL